MTSPILTVTQVSQRLAVDPRTLRRWCARGVFPHAFLIGTRWGIPLRDVLLREGQPENQEDTTS